MGFGIKVMPGVRVRVSSRGVRTSVGPRIARVHAGGGRTGISSGVGPFTTYSSGPRRRTSGGGRRRPTYASIARQQAAAERAQAQVERLDQIRRLARLFDAITTVHRTPFPSAQPPVAPEPAYVDEQRFLPAAEKAALTGISVFARADRKAARQRAAEQATQQAAAHNAELAAQHKAAQAVADEQWQLLTSNDPHTVLTVVNDAFADNPARAAAIDVTGAAITLVMFQPPLDEVPTQRPDLTPGGKPTLKRMTKTDRLTLWSTTTLSNAAATLAEAFAVAPGISEAKLAVLRVQPEALQRFVPVLAGRYSRSELAAVDWNRHVPVDLLVRRGHDVVASPGRFGELRDLDTKADLELSDLVTALEHSWDASLDAELADDEADDDGEQTEHAQLVTSPPHMRELPTTGEFHASAEAGPAPTEAVPAPPSDAAAVASTFAWTTATARVNSLEPPAQQAPPDPQALAPLPDAPTARLTGDNGVLDVYSDSIVLYRPGASSPLRLPLRDVVDVHVGAPQRRVLGYVQVVLTADPRPEVSPDTAAADPYTLTYTRSQQMSLGPLITWLRHVAEVNAGSTQ